MTEPLTGTGAATAAVTGVTLVGLVSGLDAGSVIAAFAGAVIFVLSAIDFPIWKRLLLFLVSIVVGVLAAGFTALALTSLISIVSAKVEVDRSVGALIASAAAVRVLMLFTAKPSNDSSIFDRIDRFRGGGK
jgi:hypothetical protein